MKKRIITILLALSIVCFGCSNKEASTDNYKANMESFFEKVSGLNDSINQINTNEEGYSEELVSYLYELDTAFSEMSAYEVPDTFPYVSQLSINASSNMSKSLTYFREAFSDELYNEEAAQIATQYYEEANKNLKYIIRILHGENYEDIVKEEPSSTNTIETTSDDPFSDEDDYSMYLEEDDNDYTVYNDPNYQDDLGLEETTDSSDAE